MIDMERLRRPVRGKKGVRRDPPSAARAAMGAVVVTAATINDALDQLESAPGAHDALRGELLAALSLALARVPDIEAKGLTLARVNGKERLMADTEALAAALWKDPHALDALLNGDDGLSDLSAMLGADTSAVASAANAPPGPHPMHHPARVLAQMQTLQRLDAWPSTSRHRLELLV